MEQDFYAILTGHALLTALIPATRITPVQYTQATGNPCLRYTKIDGATGLHMQGSDGLSSTLMQIDVRATDAAGVSGYKKVLQVRDVLMSLLHPFRGIVGATEFQLIQLRSDRGVQFEKPGSVEYYTTSLDFDVWSKAA
jgi:hypothetical protein